MVGYLDGKSEEISLSNFFWRIKYYNTWKETSLSTLLSNYELKDIYNADKFGIFYKYMTKKTCQLKLESAQVES